MTHVKCTHCGYDWDYSGSMQKATCPSCQTKTAVPQNEPIEADG